MPKLLLIDDDKEVLKINAKYFIQDGYTVKARPPMPGLPTSC